MGNPVRVRVPPSAPSSHSMGIRNAIKLPLFLKRAEWLICGSEQLPVPGRLLLHRAEEEKQRDGRNRQTDQEHVFREREQPAHPGDERDTASVADDDVAR